MQLPAPVTKLPDGTPLMREPLSPQELVDFNTDPHTSVPAPLAHFNTHYVNASVKNRARNGKQRKITIPEIQFVQDIVDNVLHEVAGKNFNFYKSAIIDYCSIVISINPRSSSASPTPAPRLLFPLTSRVLGVLKLAVPNQGFS